MDIEALPQLEGEEARDFTILQAIRDVDPDMFESRLSTLQGIACVDSAGLVQYLQGDDEDVNIKRALRAVVSHFTE